MRPIRSRRDVAQAQLSLLARSPAETRSVAQDHSDTETAVPLHLLARELAAFAQGAADYAAQGPRHNPAHARAQLRAALALLQGAGL